MPVPIELNSIRRMSTINIPNQDVNFDIYDFQLCAPKTDIKDAFASRELEASFCRDFSCCGLVLNDLHDLLQHYEECHVRLEDEEGSVDDSSFWSPQLSYSGSTAPNSPLLDDDTQPDAFKKKAAAYLSDLYNTNSANMAPLSPVSPLSLDTKHLSPLVEEETALIGEEPKKGGKKRPFSQSSAMELLTQSAAKKIAMAAPGDLPTPILSDEDFLAQAGALLASANANMNADKPYKCNVPGCQKAYKNPNGLKYHNQHGHCDLISDESENIASKPYQCTIGECGKRYKNLNGLKYHIEHSHMAALNHTLASFGSSIFSPLVSVGASANSSPEASPQQSPVMSSLSLASLF